MTYHRVRMQWAAGRNMPGGSAVIGVCSCKKFRSTPGSTGSARLE